MPKGATRLQRFNDRIVALYARGLTVRDIQAHLVEIYGVEVSPNLISKVTARSWRRSASGRTGRLTGVYAAIYLDAIRCKVRDDGQVVNKAAYLAVGIDADGASKTSWASGSTPPRARSSGCRAQTRGVDDVIFVCCDGLTGLPEGREWPCLWGASAKLCTHSSAASA